MSTIKLFCDLGGTYARLGVLRSGHIEDITIYEVMDFASFEDLVSEYLEGKVFGICSFYIASAGHMDKGFWRGANLPWPIASETLKTRFNFEDVTLINDFESTALSLAVLPESGYYTLHTSPFEFQSVAVVGPGTGLGLAYYRKDKDGHVNVQQTFGGHMAFGPVHEKHREIFDKVAATLGRSLIAEDLVSGPGLMRIYQAMSGKDLKTPEILSQAGKDKAARGAIEMFIGLLGLFCHQAAVYGDVKTHIVLVGDLLRALRKQKMLFESLFIEELVQDPVPIVRDRLESLGVVLIDVEHPAFFGLQAAAIS